MPRFRFIVVDSKSMRFDPIEMELASDDEARNEAIAVLVGLAKDALPDGDTHDFLAQVERDGRRLLEASLTFRCRWN